VKLCTPDKTFFLKLVFLFLLYFGSATIHAQLQPAPVFSDNMVLQRGMEVPVWGVADEDKTVTVRFHGHEVSAIADSLGNWKVLLPAMEAYNHGGIMEISAEGEEPVILSNVLIGEVWLCSGQSNMRYSISEIYPGFIDWPSLMSEADCARIRFYNRYRREGADPWEICDTNSLKNFSAAAWYFGREIQAALDVPVGLIHQSVGGSSIQKWMPSECFRELSWTRQYIQHSPLTQWEEPSKFYDVLIAPIEGFGIRGAIWYQGEANGKLDIHGYSYRYLLPELIKGWREKWGQGEFPFCFVQLPLWTRSQAWRYVRESQLLTLKSLPNTGMAVIYDADEHVTSLHPPEKEIVGERLSIWALGEVYGQPAGTVPGPLYRTFERSDNQIILYFDRVGEGLAASDQDQLVGFTIASQNRIFLPAEASISGKNSVIVYHPEISDPAAVRYTWGEDIVPGNLLNDSGLPASPFRTDTWGDTELLKSLLYGEELVADPD
jgi:sialate O-acetylesterase